MKFRVKQTKVNWLNRTWNSKVLNWISETVEILKPISPVEASRVCALAALCAKEAKSHTVSRITSSSEESPYGGNPAGSNTPRQFLTQNF